MRKPNTHGIQSLYTVACSAAPAPVTVLKTVEEVNATLRTNMFVVLGHFDAGNEVPPRPR